MDNSIFIINKQNKDRIAAWDLLKLFAIFFVLYGHCMQHLLDVNPQNNPMFLWICTFHMPLFMTLSGLFAQKLYKNSFKVYLLKRSRQILLPTLSWSLIILLITIILEDIQFISIKSLLINSLWFLKSVFICGILGYIAFKPKKHRIIWIILSILLSQFCLIWNIFSMYPCFLLGILIHKYSTEFFKYKQLIILICGCLFLGLSIYVSFNPNMWILNKGIRAALFSGELSILNSLELIIKVIIKKYILLFIGMNGALFFISFFIVVFSQIKNNFLKYLAIQGQYTLAVYVMQTVILETILPKWIFFSSSNFSLFNWFIAPILSIIILVICLYLNKLILKIGGITATLLLGIRLVTDKSQN